jgi:hypothetical protein
MTASMMRFPASRYVGRSIQWKSIQGAATGYHGANSTQGGPDTMRALSVNENGLQIWVRRARSRSGASQNDLFSSEPLSCPHD